MLLFIRIIALISVFISFTIGIIIIRKNTVPKYFYCILMGIVAYLFSNIYYLALEIDGTLNALFTLGIFGEVSFYLFGIVANLKHINSNGVKRKFSVLGLIGAIFSFGSIIFSLLIAYSREAVISSILLLPMVLCLYLSLSVIENNNKNEFNKKIKFSNWLISLFCIFNSLLQILVSCLLVDSSSMTFIIPFLVIDIFVDIVVILLPIILRKELKTWQA